MVRVKVCGITSLEDGLAAIECGADALGFIFAPSPRKLAPEAAAAIISCLPPLVSRIGVFLDHPLDDVRTIMQFCGLDMAQLHGSESPDFCRALGPRVIKSFRVRDRLVLHEMARYTASAYLMDTYRPGLPGGTGETFDWSIAREAASLDTVILSGGLNPQNVAAAIAAVYPFAVDVCSGVESSPGIKDYVKLKSFVAAVRQASCPMASSQEEQQGKNMLSYRCKTR